MVAVIFPLFAVPVYIIFGLVWAVYCIKTLQESAPWPTSLSVSDGFLIAAVVFLWPCFVLRLIQLYLSDLWKRHIAWRLHRV